MAYCDDLIGRCTEECGAQAAFVSYYDGLNDLLKNYEMWIQDRNMSSEQRTQKLQLDGRSSFLFLFLSCSPRRGFWTAA